MKLLSIVLFLSILITLHSFKLISAACHPDDVAGLLAFKSGITHDPSGMLSDWQPGTDCCKWNGINCAKKDRVTGISLYGPSTDSKDFFTGTISPSLVKLQYLEELIFNNLRNLTGPFPDFIFGLPKLRSVYIYDCKLSGQLPTSITNKTQLEQLDLGGNRFTGSIPSSISKLTKLTHLSLNGNFFTGSIPLEIGKLKKLKYLYLQHNQLSGTMPDALCTLKELSVLDLSHNSFHGSIPSSFLSLAPNLLQLVLSHNKLAGRIPDFLGKFEALATLDLSWNSFTGAVPNTFSSLKVNTLDLSHNSLVDPFPTMNTAELVEVDLSYNDFHLKGIPSFVTSSGTLRVVKLAKCGIKMNLDEWKPKDPSRIWEIDLSDNEISGSPVRLLIITETLTGFWSSGNQLKFDLGSLRIPTSLEHLDLSRNLVYGKVPADVSGLRSLNVSNNHLCGKLPATKFPESAFVGNDCLCGSPLLPCKAWSRGAVM